MKWISVSEHLPEIPEADGEFLIVVDGKLVKRSWFHTECGWDYSSVTHWMPLPAPPETGDIT
jgi:hypothetical protein